MPITAFFLFFVLLTEPALANTGFLDDVQGQYQSATSTWLDASLTWARLIFSGLITLELGWSVIEIAFGNRSLDAFVGSLTLRMISVGSALAMLTLAPAIVLPAIQDFAHIAASIASHGGQSAPSTPDAIYHSGWSIAKAMMFSTQGLSWEQQGTAFLPQAIGSLLVLGSYGLIAGQLLLANIQIMIVIAGGAFLLGFLGSRWTLPFAEKYPAMVVASGMKLVTIILIAGLGSNMSDRWIKIFSVPNPSPLDFLSVGVSVSIYALIAWNIPNYISAMAGASPAINFSSIVAAATQGGQAAASATITAMKSSKNLENRERATRTD